MIMDDEGGKKGKMRVVEMLLIIPHAEKDRWGNKIAWDGLDGRQNSVLFRYTWSPRLQQPG